MYSDEYYLNQLSYFLVFIPIFARKYTIMITEELQKLYLAYTGVPAENITELPSSGSNRRYFRLAGVQTLIGVYGTCIDENEAFLYMAAISADAVCLFLRFTSCRKIKPIICKKI